METHKHARKVLDRDRKTIIALHTEGLAREIIKTRTGWAVETIRKVIKQHQMDQEFLRQRN